MAFQRLFLYRSLAKYTTHSTRQTAGRASPDTNDCNRAFKLYTKSHIASIFSERCPGLDPNAYLAAAQVFPMRANNHVVEDLIDWCVSAFLEFCHLSLKTLRTLQVKYTSGSYLPTCVSSTRNALARVPPVDEGIYSSARHFQSFITRKGRVDPYPSKSASSWAEGRKCTPSRWWTRTWNAAQIS